MQNASHKDMRKLLKQAEEPTPQRVSSAKGNKTMMKRFSRKRRGATDGRGTAIDAAEWDALAGPANPFISHAFLQALEKGGAVGGNSGWDPMHLLLRSDDGQLLGAMPNYLKHHSYGEYIFDHGWANAFERAGGVYYPKLLAAIPFTPATGPRFLVRDNRADLKTALAKK